MLEENLRQKCIYTSVDKESYWKYMMRFSTTCADFMEPKFDSSCAADQMKDLNIDSGKVKDCMDNVLVKKDYTLIKNDVDKYNKGKVFQLPQLRINNQKFRVSITFNIGKLVQQKLLRSHVRRYA